MDPAIDLYGQPNLITVEVENEASERMLLPEVKPLQTTTA